MSTFLSNMKIASMPDDIKISFNKVLETTHQELINTSCAQAFKEYQLALKKKTLSRFSTQVAFGYLLYDLTTDNWRIDPEKAAKETTNSSN